MKNKVIVMSGDSLGRGDEQLGSILISNFLRLLGEKGKEKLPEAIFFSNHGIKLVCGGSKKIDHLKILEQKGVRLLVCRTCLEYLGLLDQVVIGKVSGMPDLIELMSKFEIVSL